jgi:hypothetical protein
VIISLWPFERGYFCSALDALESRVRPLIRRFVDPACLQMAGFTSISNALLSMSQGSLQLFAGGNINKVGTAGGAVGACVDLWYVGNNPAAGAAPSGVPGGTVPTNATTGEMIFNSPAPAGQYTNADGRGYADVRRCNVGDALRSPILGCCHGFIERYAGRDRHANTV